MPRYEGIACALCHDTVMGKTRSEAVEDAMHLGWESRQGQWVCDQCILEEDQL